MADMVSELFREFEMDFERLRMDIDHNLESIGDSEASSSFVDRSLAEALKRASDAENSLRQMEMEAKMLPPDQRRGIEPKLRRYREELAERSKVLNTAQAAANRRALLDESGELGPKSRRDRERLLGVDDALRRSSSRLEEAQQQALETEQIGIDVMGDLRAQRDMIWRTSTNVNEIGENVSRAKHILGAMGRRAMANRVLMYCSVGSLGFMVLGAAYFGFKAEEELQLLPGFRRVDNHICAGTPYTDNVNIGCNGFSEATELQCQHDCANSVQAEKCPEQTCFAAAFYPSSRFCHLFTEPECASLTAITEVVTFKKASSNKCIDDPTFVDEQLYKCGAWAYYHCSEAVDHWKYSQEGARAVLEKCPMTCGECKVTGAGCTDDKTFVDESHLKCAAWSGYDCKYAVRRWKYTWAGARALIDKCPMSCGLCKVA